MGDNMNTLIQSVGKQVVFFSVLLSICLLPLMAQADHVDYKVNVINETNVNTPITIKAEYNGQTVSLAPKDNHTFSESFGCSNSYTRNITIQGYDRDAYECALKLKTGMTGGFLGIGASCSITGVDSTSCQAITANIQKDVSMDHITITVLIIGPPSGS